MTEYRNDTLATCPPSTHHRILTEILGDPRVSSCGGVFEITTRVSFLGSHLIQGLMGLHSHLTNHQPQVKQLEVSFVRTTEGGTSLDALDGIRPSVKVVRDVHCDKWHSLGCTDPHCYQNIVDSRLIVMRIDHMAQDPEKSLKAIWDYIYWSRPETLLIIYGQNSEDLCEQLHNSMTEGPEVEVLITNFSTNYSYLAVRKILDTQPF